MRLFLAAIMLGGLTGCTAEPATPAGPTPLPTDGPNQVVLLVAGMTCRSCPDKVAAALGELPWVVPHSCTGDTGCEQVKFTVTDPAAFDLAAADAAVKRAGYSWAKTLAGPTQ